MAQCKMCGRKGFLLSVSANGLCKPCDAVFVLAVQQRGRVIWDCMKLINESKNTETRLSRCDLLIEHAQALLQYENMGIYTVNPSPSQLLSQYKSILAQLRGEQAVGQLRRDKGFETRGNAGDKQEVECPYCGVELAPVPKRKTKCRACGNDVYVRSDPFNKQRAHYLKREDALSLDMVKNLQVTEKEFRKAERDAPTGRPLRRVIEGLLDMKRDKATRSGDWHSLKMVAFEQARLQHDLGEDFFDTLQEAARSDLHCYRSQGVKRVEVYTTGCETCKRMNGKVFTVSAALNSMPIPVKECENGWCCCIYVPTID